MRVQAPATPTTSITTARANTERQILSVANLTRADGHEFFERLQSVHVRTETTIYPLKEANRALEDLRHGRIKGAAVLVPEAD